LVVRNLSLIVCLKLCKIMVM